MTLSVDVNALFDRLALLVTEGEPGDGGSTLEARVAALESAVFLIPNTYIDGTSFVILDATSASSNPTIAWDDPVIEQAGPNKLFDDDQSTYAQFYINEDINPTGFSFVEFDAGSVIDISGFAIKPVPNPYDDNRVQIPTTTRLMARLSNSDPWTTIETLILDSQPTTADPIQVVFQSDPSPRSESYRYFRFEFDAVWQVNYSEGNNYSRFQFESIKLIAT